MQLSCSDDYLMVGNFMADMMDLRETEAMPKEFHRGVALHRLIDSFTDAHPVVRQVNKLLHENHHKYAPVVSDVIFDFFLGENWKEYDQRDLPSFCRFVYEVIGDHTYLLQPKKQAMVKAMIDDNFLFKYTTLEGMAFVLEKMGRRSRFSSNFPKAIDDIQIHHDVIDGYFNSFYPDLINEVQQFCHC